MSKPTDEIRTQLLSGDQSYLEMVFQESYQYATAFLKKKRYASADEAHDIYIDAVMILRNRIVSGGLTEITNVKSLIVGICINLNKEMLYKKYKLGEKEEEVRNLFYSKGYDIEDHDEEEFKIQKEICLKAMATLGEKCQNLLRYYHYDGLTMIEIAEVMGFASANVAKTLKSRCFQKLLKKAQSLRTLIK